MDVEQMIVASRERPCSYAIRLWVISPYCRLKIKRLVFGKLFLLHHLKLFYWLQRPVASFHCAGSLFVSDRRKDCHSFMQIL
jgi:hypothetical protein